MHSDQSAPDGHSMITPDLSPAKEARKVIDTETRCHQAEIKEPAFLIAMRCFSDFGTFPNLALQCRLRHLSYVRALSTDGVCERTV